MTDELDNNIQFSNKQKTGTIIAAVLVVCGLAVFIYSLLYSADFPRHIRLRLTLISFACMPAGLIILLVLNSKSIKQKQTLQDILHRQNHNNLSDAEYRSETINKAIHNKFDYHSELRVFYDTAILISVLICIVLFFMAFLSSMLGNPFSFNNLYWTDAFLFTIFAMPVLFGSGFMWFDCRSRRDDFIIISDKGISFCNRGDRGFERWENIKEVETTRWGYELKTPNTRLLIRFNIEPADIPTAGFSRRLIEKEPNKCATELMTLIRRMAPNVRQIHWYNFSRY